MSNFHLKDRTLSLKSKGLLSVILSLPDDWNYSTRGLAAISKEGIDCIGAALRELEAAGYIRRNKLRDDRGRITDTEYVIYECPQANPDIGNSDTLPPDTENPYMDEPPPEMAAEYNTISNKRKNDIYTDLSNIHQSIPASASDTNDAIDIYRDILKENIEYDHLCEQHKYRVDEINEILELMLDTICTLRRTIRIGGEDKLAELVKSRMLKIDGTHIDYVLESLSKNTTEVRNIRSYLLTTLYNAPVTISNYYKARVNHDLYGDK